MNSLKDLPFPVVQNVNHPVNEILYNENTDLKQFFFTIPIDVLRPAPCTLNEIKDSQRSYHYRTLLSCFCQISMNMMYCEEPYRKKSMDDQERIQIYMEYLVPSGTDMDDFKIIDCIGIRFHFYVNDDMADINQAVLDMVKDNREKIRQFGKKQQQMPIPLYQKYLDVDHMCKWYVLSNTYLGKPENQENFMDKTSGDAEGVPGSHHPFNPIKVFSWENSHIEGMSAAQTVESRKFAFPKAIYKIDHSLFNPTSMLVVTLPRCFRWVCQNKRDFNDTLDALLDKKFLKAYFSGAARYIKRNDLKDLKQVQDIKYKKIINNPNLDRDEKIKILRDFRRKSIKYIENLWSPNSNVSDPIKLMAKYASEKKTWTVGPVKVLDPDMSYFGNMIANEFLELETTMKLSTTHSIMFRVMVNNMGAYRYKRDLHNNVILLGKGASGKSHILNEICDILVPGTVTKVSHATAKAHAIDEDRNDHLTQYHEMPPALLGTDKFGQETGDPILKDMMTSCEVVTKTINVDSDTNRRQEVICSSECVGQITGASNERQDKIPEAMATRMIAITVNEYKRKLFGVQQKSTKTFDAELNGKNSSHDMFCERWRMRQIMVNMIEKMIYENNLKDVDMTLCSCMFDALITYMKKKGLIYADQDSVRGNKFLKHFARTLTIIFAADKFANDPSMYGYGKEITMKNLQYIQPLLVCNEEIALFSFSMCLDQLINFNHFIVMEYLLFSVQSILIKDASGEPDVKHGYIYTGSAFHDERALYRRLVKSQSNNTFDIKMSAENIKVAAHDLTKRSFRMLPIIEFKHDTKSVGINKAYVDQHFIFDEDEGRYISKFNPLDMVQNVFYNGYSHRCLRPRKQCILGTVFDINLPFLLDTFDMMPNPSKSLTIHNQDYDFLRSNPDDMTPEETDETTIVKAFHIMKTDYEDLTFKNYLIMTGLYNTMPDLHIKDLQYDFIREATIEINTSNNYTYPKNLAWVFASSHGVGTINKRKLDTNIAEDKIENTKRSRN